MIYLNDKEQSYLELSHENWKIPINIGFAWVKKVSEGGRELDFEDYKRFERLWEANI